MAKIRAKPTGRRRRRPHQERPLRRRVEFRTPRRTFLVFCEGTKTEPDYISALRQEPAVRESASVDLRVATSGGVPLTLVNAAAGVRARSSQEQGEIDEVWCLFDVEWPRNHPGLSEARARAEVSGVRLAISNPCFELWLALHFENRTAWLDNDAAGKLRRGHDKSSGKGLDGSVYMPRRADAAQRARALTAKHAGDGTESRTTIHLRACTSSWRRSHPTGRTHRRGRRRCYRSSRGSDSPSSSR